MGAEKEIIVAVELGSTAIRAIAGKRETDGIMQVLAIVQEEGVSCIRNGVVDNIDKTTAAISRVVKKLNEALNINTTRVYVGVSGQSLHAVKNHVTKTFEGKTLITAQMVESLRETNHGVIYPDAQIKEVVPQEYGLGTRTITDPVGVQSEQVEGRYLNIIARSSLSENIERCVHNAGLEVAGMPITPVCLADFLLTSNEKRSGCALVDIGAETTTIIVYTNKILRQLVVIPVGAADVTNDIASYNIDPEEAEMLKLTYGNAWQDEEQEDKSAKITLSHNRNIDATMLQEIVEARYEEIILNVWSRIKEHNDKILSGIVFTGGGSKIKNLLEAFKKHTDVDKQLRVAKGMPVNVTLAPTVQTGDRNIYSLIGILLKGDQNCVGEPPSAPREVQTELDFGTDKEEDVQPNKPATTEEEPAQETPTADTDPQPKAKQRSLGSRLKKIWGKVSEMLSEPEE